MSVKPYDLKDVNTRSIEDIHQSFARAASAYGRAGDDFDENVWNRLRAGHVWSGTGSKKASHVAEVNSLAFAASAAAANTAQLALDGFCKAIDRAHDKLTRALDEAYKNGIDVRDDGTAYIVDEQSSHGPEHLSGVGGQPKDIDEIKDRVERRVKGALAFATIADQSCRQVLASLHEPKTEPYDDPGTLAYNRDALATNLSAQSLAKMTKDFWSAAKPKTVPKSDDGQQAQAIIGDVIDISVCTSAIVASGLLDLTVVGAILGAGIGIAAGYGVEHAGEDLWDQMHKKDPKLPRTAPPGTGDKILAEAAEKGHVSDTTLRDHPSDMSFTPRSPDTDGESPRPGEPPADHSYKRYTIHPESGRKEWVIVDTDTGDVYYCDHFEDDEPTSFTKIT